MVSDQYMREKLKQAYSGKGWAKKVDRMPPGQVLAIYKEFLDKKKI